MPLSGGGGEGGGRFAFGPSILSRGGILPAGVGQDRPPSLGGQAARSEAEHSRALLGAWGSQGRDECYQERK